MKFKFTKNLDYQLEAIDAVLGVFDTGKNITQNESGFSLQSYSNIISNELEIDPNQILENLRSIQKQNNIEDTHPALRIDDNNFLLTEDGGKLLLEGKENISDFSIEMETGTGKTYVYLRTALALNQKYGLKKFIILVPSVAIREGVLKTIEQTKDHFRDLFNISFGSFAYDSDKLSQVRDFAYSNDIQIMIMTIQSFNSDGKVLRQTDRDNTYGEKSYLDLIAKTNPVVVMDEPQNMESELSKASISDLNSLFKLRYGATHKEIHNLVYRLTPVDAYKKGLVKKIAVYGVRENDADAFVFKVKSIETKKGENPKAKVVLEVKNADDSYVSKEINLEQGDDVYRKTKKNQKYEGLIVQNIDANHNRVELSDGNFYSVDQMSENKEAIFRTQIRETIKAHFDKQQEIGDQIKVLSLFFIDKVDNYVLEDSLIRNLFIEEFTKLQKNYNKFKNIDVNSVHAGYFASKKVKGIIEYKDSTTGSSKEDKEIYDLIMKNKEKLLSFNEPVSFIFSHSALKEGWDNPNIFQICTLRETKSIMKKRQEIGRGLRLPVDVNGDRVYNPEINVLTVVANSSYEEYAGGLQQEFEDAGYKGQTDILNAKEQKIKVSTTKHIDSEEFKELWERISKRTKFSLEVLTDVLIKKSVEKINKLNIKSIRIIVERGEISFNSQGNFQGVREAAGVGYKTEHSVNIPNIVDRIARETGITCTTIFNIISETENLDLIFENPEEYIRSIILIIKATLNDLLINEGLKYIPTGEIWEIKLLFDEFYALPSKLIPSLEGRSVFDHVIFDSNGEREFAEHLEQSTKVKVYTKLPRGFVVDTPLGNYIPDWAVVWKTNDGDKLYLVRETKFGYDNLEKQLTFEEQKKIECAKKHFETIGVDYKVSESKELLDLV